MPGRFSKDHTVATSWWRTCFWKKSILKQKCIPWTYWRHQLLKQVEFWSFRAFSAFTDHLSGRGNAIAALELKPFLEKVFVAWQFYCCFSGWMLEVASFFSVSWFFSCDFRRANHWGTPPHSLFTKDGVEDEESQEEQQSKRSSDSLIFLDGLRMMYGGGDWVWSVADDDLDDFAGYPFFMEIFFHKSSTY